MLIDTHCHLNFSAFRDDLGDIVGRMREEGMRAIVVGSQNSTSKRAVDLAGRHNNLYAAVGLHPVHCFSMRIEEEGMPFTTRQEDFDPVYYEELALEPRVVAIGECGLDYHSFPAGVPEHDCKKKEWRVFEQQISLAKKIDRPVIIHCRPSERHPRDAYEDLRDALLGQRLERIVIHAFMGTRYLAKEFLSQGCMISFTGLVTYPELSALLDLVRYVPLDRIMIETDAPYMAPIPHRGRRNEPLWLHAIAETLARAKNCSVDEFVAATTHNAETFFRLEALSKK